MRFFNLKDKLQEIIKKVDIKLPHGNINESLVSLNYCKKRNWKLLYFDDYFLRDNTDFIAPALKRLQIEKVEIFLYNADTIRSFHSATSECKIIEAGVYYYKNATTENSVIEDSFYYPELNSEHWDELDIIGRSMIITNATLDFIIFGDSSRENFYFYGDSNFLDSIFPINYKNYYEQIIEDTYALLNKEYFRWLRDHYMKEKK